jgi:hypothetical protein
MDQSMNGAGTTPKKRGKKKRKENKKKDTPMTVIMPGRELCDNKGPLVFPLINEPAARCEYSSAERHSSG